MLISRQQEFMANIVLILAVATLLAISITDIKYMLIPDKLLICLAVLGLVYGIITTPNIWPALLLGGTLGSAAWLIRYSYQYIRGVPGLGLGDCKMLFVCGLWLQYDMIPPFLIITGICGIITALLWQRCGYGPHFPLAPSLATGTISILYMPSLLKIMSIITIFI